MGLLLFSSLRGLLSSPVGTGDTANGEGISPKIRAAERESDSPVDSEKNGIDVGVPEQRLTVKALYPCGWCQGQPDDPHGESAGPDWTRLCAGGAISRRCSRNATGLLYRSSRASPRAGLNPTRPCPLLLPLTAYPAGKLSCNLLCCNVCDVQSGDCVCERSMEELSRERELWCKLSHQSKVAAEAPLELAGLPLTVVIEHFGSSCEGGWILGSLGIRRATSQLSLDSLSALIRECGDVFSRMNPLIEKPGRWNPCQASLTAYAAASY